MIVNNEKEAIQLLQSLRMASDHTRRDLMARSIQDQAYFAGCQWIHSNGQYGSAKIGRLLTSLNPDKRKLRVTLNRVTRNVLRAASSTRPSKILAEVTPLGDRSGPDDYHLADLFETMLEGAIDSTGFLNCARQANLRRCVSGTYGVGFALDATQSRRNVGGVERDVPDIRLRAMMFPAYYLSLDPSVDSHNLCDHDEVVYSDIWTKAKAERVLGQKLDEKDLLPIGQLAAHELAMNELVGYTLFEKYRKDSQKLGVRVHQMHVKTEDGRFGQMFVILETKGSRRIVNADNPETPFGGHAMPLGLIRAHARADCHWGLSDVSMVKADQDILNLHATQYHRIMQKAGHPKWIVDRRALGRSVSEEEVARNLNNEVAGPIFVDPGRRDEKAVMPTMHNLPGPQPFLLEGQDRSEQAILDGTFRAPGHVGQTKSHVADASFQRAIEEADVPVGIRVEEDIETYDKLLTCVLATYVKSGQAESFTTLREMQRLGMDEVDMGTVLQSDSENLPVKVAIRQSSVRYRGPLRRRQDLEQSVQMGATNAAEYRHQMAKDLDTPTGRDDATWSRWARKTARDVLLGVEFEGIMAGVMAGQWILSELSLALTDPRARDPETRDRLNRAIAAQQQANLQEAFATDPELAMRQAEQAQPADPQALPDEVSLSELLTA